MVKMYLNRNDVPNNDGPVWQFDQKKHDELCEEVAVMILQQEPALAGVLLCLKKMDMYISAEKVMELVKEFYIKFAGDDNKDITKLLEAVKNLLSETGFN